MTLPLLCVLFSSILLNKFQTGGAYNTLTITNTCGLEVTCVVTPVPTPTFDIPKTVTFISSSMVIVTSAITPTITNKQTGKTEPTTTEEPITSSDSSFVTFITALIISSVGTTIFISVISGIIVYAIKGKSGIHRPQLTRRMIPLHELELVDNHIYDLPHIDNPPPLPPRKVTVMNKLMLESSKKVINEAESTFIEETYGQDTSHDYCDSKDVNHEVQLGLFNQLQVAEGIPLQKNEAYGLGLVLENIQTPLPTADLVSEPVTSTSSTTTSDPHTTNSASKYEQISTYYGPQLHTAGQLDLCTTVENTHVDHESDSDHQSYEQVCSYEKVQPCDIEHILVQVSKEGHCHQDPSLQGEALKEDSKHDVDNMDTAGSDNETGTSPAESLNSYERVWGYERIHHCDLHLEEFMAQKDDNTTFTVAKTNDNWQ